MLIFLSKHSLWWYTCYNVPISARPFGLMILGYFGVFRSFSGEIGTATGLGSAVAEVRHILSRSCPFLVEQIMWVTRIPKLVSWVFARFFQLFNKVIKRKEPGVYIGKGKFVLRNGTILLELLSSVHDYGTFAAYMAGEAGEMHGGGYAGDGFGAQLSAVLDLH